MRDPSIDGLTDRDIRRSSSAPTFSLEITPNFPEQRPGAIRLLRRAHGIPDSATVIAEAGYLRFFYQGITADHARPFFESDIRAAMRAQRFTGRDIDIRFCDWSQIH